MNSLDVNWRVKTGTAVVTAKRGDIISKCNVTINSDEYYAPVNFFDATIPIELKKGNTGMITINLDEEVTDKSCYYYSSNESVCSVSDKGELKALTVGSSAITVYSKDLGKFVKKIIRVIE